MIKNLDNITLRNLLTKIQAGDRNAFGQLYLIYKKKVYNFAYRFVRNPDEAAELTQAVFVQLWENKAKISVEKNFDAYLYSMIRSNFLNALKKKARMCTFLQSEPDEPSINSTESYMDFTDCRRIAMNAVESLSPQAKMAYILSRDKGCSHEEISMEMGISKNTVSNHIKKSLGHIRNHLRYFSPDSVLPFLLLILATIPDIA